jgi:hypothetical protein
MILNIAILSGFDIGVLTIPKNIEVPFLSHTLPMQHGFFALTHGSPMGRQVSRVGSAKTEAYPINARNSAIENCMVVKEVVIELDALLGCCWYRTRKLKGFC